MAAKSFKITFTLGDEDTAYFRKIYRSAKKHASPDEAPEILRAVKRLVKEAAGVKSMPEFVRDAITTLEDLVEMIEDEAYAAPKPVIKRALAALAYFAHPQDVIPDYVPLVGYLDDAIMIKFVEEELKHEIWGYRRFKRFRQGAEQRPWTSVAQTRLPKRLAEKRKEIREKVRQREARGKSLGW